MAKTKPYRYPLYLIVRIAAWGLYLLPRPILLNLARWIGGAGYWILPHHRESVLANLRTAYGVSLSERKIREIAYGVFKNLTETAADVLQFPKSSQKSLKLYADCSQTFGVMDRLFAEGKGVILLTSHIGNWELLGGLCKLNGYPGKPIARRLRYEPYQKWIESLRRSVSVEAIYRDESPRIMIQELRRNGLIGVLPDQDIDSVKGVFVNFFGLPAYTSVAPVKLSLATGAPIMTCFLVRKPHDRYEMIVGDVIRPSVQSSREESILRFTQQWTSSCEAIIRKFPAQWGWVHNRWKTSLTHVA